MCTLSSRKIRSLFFLWLFSFLGTEKRSFANNYRNTNTVLTFDACKISLTLSSRRKRLSSHLNDFDEDCDKMWNIKNVYLYAWNITKELSSNKFQKRNFISHFCYFFLFKIMKSYKFEILQFVFSRHFPILLSDSKYALNLKTMRNACALKEDSFVFTRYRKI